MQTSQGLIISLPLNSKSWSALRIMQEQPTGQDPREGQLHVEPSPFPEILSSNTLFCVSHIQHLTNPDSPKVGPSAARHATTGQALEVLRQNYCTIGSVSSFRQNENENENESAKISITFAYANSCPDLVGHPALSRPEVMMVSLGNAWVMPG